MVAVLTFVPSDLPTVEELMKPIRIDSFGVSGFDLQPVRYEFLGMDRAGLFIYLLFCHCKLLESFVRPIFPIEGRRRRG